MTLDAGLFCVFQAPGSPPPDAITGLPGVRITLPPGLSGRPEAVTISTFRQDGWLDGTAALVRVADAPAQVLVTIYQSPRQGPDTAPRLQVLRLSGGAPASAAAPAAAAPQAEPEIVAHVQRTGDVGGLLGEWIGTRGSKSWIEGFALKPHAGVAPEDIEYQGVLGRGWLSPWVDGGKFCGSRGMALPLLGIKVRLKGGAAREWDCSYEATFTDGSAAGPVSGDEACEAESLASLEAFRIELYRRDSPAAEQEPGAVVKPVRSGRPGARVIRPGGAR
jgi:Clostridial hydrophobic W